jgi:predicted TPR repeat methyltransferase
MAKSGRDYINEAYTIANSDAMVEFYNGWSENYDEQLDGLGYIAPMTIARLLCGHVTDKDANILDVGCGTGMTCALLKEEGYTNLHGIDISDDMVDKAMEKGIYESARVANIMEPLMMPSNHFDAIISSGTFTYKHVGSESLDEIFRVLKPNGYFACTVNSRVWQSHGFESKFDTLINNGSIECLFLEEDKYYEGSKPEAKFCVYRKLN